MNNIFLYNVDDLESIADKNLKFDPQAQITLSNKDGMKVYLQKRDKFSSTF